MAINLWEASGKPTAYNPLPKDWQNIVYFNIGEYIVTFKAKSATSSIVWVTGMGSLGVNIKFNLTNEFQNYTTTFKFTDYRYLAFYDLNSIGDIIIEDIKIVEKPRVVVKKPKKNLFPPFSQWIVPGNAVVISDYVATVKGLGGLLMSKDLPVLPSTDYYVLVPKSHTDTISDAIVKITYKDKNKATILDQWSPGGFKTQANCVFVEFTLYSATAGTATFTNPMLNLGTITQPFEPYVIINPPAVKVALKQPSIAFEKKWDTQPYPSRTTIFNSINNGVMRITSTGIDPNLDMVGLGSFDPHIYRYIEIKYRVVTGVSNAELFFTNAEYPGATAGQMVMGNLISDNQWRIARVDMWTNKNWKNSFVTGWRYDWANADGVTMDLEYIRLVKDDGLVTKPTQTGLAMNGTTNYLQLPKITMDSVEVDCIVDHVNTSAIMIDARPASGYMYHETSKGAGFISHYIDGVFNVNLVKGKRVKAMAVSGSTFTEDITIFASAASENLKGTLYGVKCYLDGVVVAEYDFTNRNEKANSVIMGPKSWKLAKR